MSSRLGDHVLTRSDGRRVAWAEWGDRDGAPTVLSHRNPGSRLLDPDPAATDAAGVRLITIDRPGYGGTDPVARPTLEAVAADAVAVIDGLDVDTVALIGWSGGGMFALETAAALGSRLRSLSLVCTPAPDDEIPWVPEEFRPLTEQARADPERALAVITEACAFYASDPEAAAETDPGAADEKVRSEERVITGLREMMREGARQGAVGMAADIVAGSVDSDLPLSDIRAPVLLWYGDADWIGPEHGRWYESRSQDAQLTVVPDAGHLLPLANWRAILESAVAPGLQRHGGSHIA